MVSSYTAPLSAESGFQESFLPWAFRNDFVIASLGKTDVVAPELRPHVRYGCALRYGQGLHSFSCILEDPADTALDRDPFQDVEDDVLGAGPWLEPASEDDSTILGLGMEKGMPAMAEATSSPPAPIASIPMPPAVGYGCPIPGVSCPGLQTSRDVPDGRYHCRPREVDAVFFCNILEKPVVICIFISD